MKAILLASVAAFIASPAYADDWTVSPWTTDLDPVTVAVGGLAYGALFAPDVPKSPGAPQHWATGAADLNLKISRDYDSGLSLALKSSFEVVRDRLSYDNYGGNLVQKVYGVVQTGLGSFELGMTDGAACALAVTGPVVDDITSLDNPNAVFFIDPSTGRAFQEVFGLSTGVNSSLNYAKLSYYTPRILGLQIGVSYTPSENREVIPFLNNGPHALNRQKSIWETAVSYSETFEDFSVGVYGAAAFGHGDGKGADDAGLTDWGLGTEIDIPLTEELKFAVGGGYRHANTDGFDIYAARTSGGTESAHMSSTLTWNDFIVGAEYGRGTADGGVGAAVIGVKAYEVSAGYTIDTNMQVTVGWQQLRYDRNLDTYYDGSRHIQMDAAFLHVKFKV